MRRFRCVLALSLLVAVSANSWADPSEDQAAILKGVQSIELTGTPGTLLLYSADAFPLAEVKQGDAFYPVAAASRLGKGRVAAFSHESAFNDSFGKNETLMQNLLAWLADFTGKQGQPNIAVYEENGFAAALKERGIAFLNLKEGNWNRALSQADLIVADLKRLDAKQTRDLLKFVRKGGGLLAGMPGWAWQGYFAKPGEQLANDAPANAIFKEAGIVWTDRTVSLADNQATASNTESLVKTNVLNLLDAIESGRKPDGLTFEQIAGAIQQIGGSLPADDEILIPRFRKLLEQQAVSIEPPSVQNPIRTKDESRALPCLLESIYATTAPAEKLLPSKLAEPALGTIPSAAKAQTVEATIDTSIPGRHGFGAYALPGELVELKLPASAAKAGLKIRVGAHSDKLWDKDKWERPPQLDRVFPVTGASTKVANAFGGLVYLEVPRECSLGTIEIEAANVLVAPYYKHNVTHPAEWRASLRNAPGPWAELECDKVILTLPSEMIRQLDFPEKLMEHWIQVLDACADLAGISPERERGERIVVDVQPSAGWMHSGYPIIANMRASAPMGSYETMLGEGDWGYYHELGHNHQQREWTFDGTGEVTCNLFVLYAYDTVHEGKAVHRFSDMTKWHEQARTHIANGAPFDKWKSDPFLALTMYEQLQAEFGWEPFKKIFRDYRALSANEKPQTDLARRDQWMVRFSKEVNRNLGPFFEKWGVPTSKSARASIAELPAWMPNSLEE